MAKQVNIHAAKTNFSKLVEEVENGADIVIARAGKPVLRLVKYEPAEETQLRAVPRELGFARGMFPNFDQEAFDAADAEIYASINWNKFDYLLEQEGDKQK